MFRMVTGGGFVAPDPYAGGNQAATAWIRAHKEATPCADCGDYHPWWVMDADHIDGSTSAERVKRLPPSTQEQYRQRQHGSGGTSGAAWLKRDIQEGRAEIVCPICHKHRTHRRREAKRGQAA